MFECVIVTVKTICISAHRVLIRFLSEALQYLL